ncbi:NAD(P)/FAD-dependent oxidoreductase [Mesorhizobium sp. CAU 1741]|uniref:phytoene desaturase family protein n=1 Tax=Mesorhizobium sp. CAU 1741 TaxID=3140366 RepID=UPI00325ACC22
MTSSDAIVIGGGHNGLVAATLLARSGRKVVLLEAEGEVGGAARTHEFHPGFRVSSIAHILNRLHPDVVKAMDLQRHGLTLEGRAMASVALGDAEPVVLRGAYGEMLDGVPASEATAWKELRAQLIRYAGVLTPLLARRPPDLAGMPLSEKLALGGIGLSLRRLGREDMRDFLRMLLMNVSDVLDEHLTSDALRGLVAFDAVLGSHLGPRSPTSLVGLYYRLAGEVGGVPGGQMLPQGGMGGVVSAMAASAAEAGVAIRTGTQVARILVEKGRSVGVGLANGEELRAATIVSAINPRTTFLDLVGSRDLDTGIVRKVQNVRMKGNVAKLHLALDRVPDFSGVAPEDHKGRLVIAPSASHVERAFNPAKYGAFSPEPVMEIVLPSLSDAALAPDGACVLSANVQFAPYALKGGWNEGRPAFQKAIMAQLERHAPGIGSSVIASELLTPADIETRFQMPGGHWHHGELQPDQMLMSRPFFGAGGYDTPIDGLFLAGAGSHPGGGVSGVPGMNAARRVMAVTQ